VAASVEMVVDPIVTFQTVLTSPVARNVTGYFTGVHWMGMVAGSSPFTVTDPE
jgi:hypothetical protein